MDEKPIISDELLAMVRCPADRTPLQRADASLIQRLNEQIAGKRLLTVGGDPVELPLNGGLVRGDGKILYPVYEGFARLLVDEGIDLSQLEDTKQADA